MRISDWNSDVCSSDLFWEGEDGTFYVNLYIPATADWAARKAGVTLDSAYPYSATAELRFDKLRPGTFPVALRVPGWAAGKAQVTVHGEAATPAFTRSEAHTSELPSLMRISFAVFCLKKK